APAWHAPAGTGQPAHQWSLALVRGTPGVVVSLGCAPLRCAAHSGHRGGRDLLIDLARTPVYRGICRALLVGSLLSPDVCGIHRNPASDQRDHGRDARDAVDGGLLHVLRGGAEGSPRAAALVSTMDGCAGDPTVRRPP